MRCTGKWAALWLALAGASALPARAWAGDIACPAQLKVSESADPTHMNEWQSFDSNASGLHHFYAVAFSQGPPSELVYFNPKDVIKTATSKVERYDFGTEVAGDLWISCLYRDTSQILARRLDPKPTACRVSYDRDTNFRSVKVVHCD